MPPLTKENVIFDSKQNINGLFILPRNLSADFSKIKFMIVA